MATTKALSSRPVVGLGGSDFSIAVYIANRPPLAEFERYSSFRGMSDGEIRFIADQAGNHWRKVFNVYAKFAFEMDNEDFASWQDLRDGLLLQVSSRYSLLFSEPDFCAPHIHIVMGKGYASKLRVLEHAAWVDEHFALDEERKLIVCPYFDYRQLSNKKIESLVGLVRLFG